jgi:hypothetical protein
MLKNNRQVNVEGQSKLLTVSDDVCCKLNVRMYRATDDVCCKLNVCMYL